MSVSTFDALDLRSAFRSAASSAWVITGNSPDGPVGFTAISVVSVSTDPPMVSFNLAKSSSSLTTISRTRRAALHLLAQDQAWVATRFAGDRAHRFVDDGSWSPAEDGLPWIGGAAARLLTEVVDLVDAGDSYIAITRVDAIDTTDRSPLVHHAGGFHPLTPRTLSNGA